MNWWIFAGVFILTWLCLDVDSMEDAAPGTKLIACAILSLIPALLIGHGVTV